jgi:hypothetical protein
VWQAKATKAPGVQIRPAPAGMEMRSPDRWEWDEPTQILNILNLPTTVEPHPFQSDFVQLYLQTLDFFRRSTIIIVLPTWLINSLKNQYLCSKWADSHL